MASLLFVAGHGSGAGKSTVCLAVLYHLLEQGVPAEELAYIKPATQCESVTDVAAFCAARRIEAVPVGPVVFRKGFTNSILRDEQQDEKSAELMTSIKAAVKSVSDGRRFVVIDGVGYPSVGSCCGLGNATVAAALGAPILLVGPPGLGDCIDTFDLMLTYFNAKGARVAGAIVNRLEDTERHAVSDVLPLVEQWFKKQRPWIDFLGGIPPVGRVAPDGTVKDAEAFASEVHAAAVKHTQMPRFVGTMRQNAAEPH
uniref:CobQ/CobB/MinD/ParA nucleotide binding domain-containing protein n=1 Tax=Neobodo designis TaxID=312471 RepID=A0A7S1W895_NEODS|mmetsp:Transcript_681/g.2386  ORF Transcript_681/g.2386 Transcript_681/m.2386 type:complete len:256 (+) Transcript_681:31-798(+)